MSEDAMTTPTPRTDALFTVKNIGPATKDSVTITALYNEFVKLERELAAAQSVERERCAKIVEQYSVEIEGMPRTSRSLKPLADIIRSGE